VADEALPRKRLKVAAVRGGGPPPGLEWNIWSLDLAYDEAMEFLDSDQYRHVAQQFWDLARQPDPTHSEIISVRPIEDFHELRDWGGILYPHNVRVFFGVDKMSRAIVVLGAIDKKNDGATPTGDRVRMRRRWRKYCNGDYE
jgi:hypothetical protein